MSCASGISLFILRKKFPGHLDIAPGDLKEVYSRAYKHALGNFYPVIPAGLGAMFYEYFHGDDGVGIGASHQTGWKGLVANLLSRSSNGSGDAPV